jgi:hypothetical protein
VRRHLPLLIALLAASRSARPYSVLLHEALVDAPWDVSIKSVVLTRFPKATPEDLKAAHAYARTAVRSFRIRVKSPLGN